MNNTFFKWAVLILLVGILGLNFVNVLATGGTNARINKLIYPGNE